MHDYAKRIKAIIIDKTGAEPEDVTRESYFEDDLNIGEMELVEILSELEEEFKVDLVDSKDTILTIQDLLDLINEQIE